ncbi:hypothetical protein [Crenothrix sp.]
MDSVYLSDAGYVTGVTLANNDSLPPAYKAGQKLSERWVSVTNAMLVLLF